MAGVDVGSGSGHKRATNSDINMVPFIDLLFVTIAFLLITAVWVTNSRIAASTDVPGQTGCGDQCPPPGKSLHVTISENQFGLVWKQGSTVVSERQVPKQPVAVGNGSNAGVRYPDLVSAIQSEWTQSGEHRDPSDQKHDQAVLHTDDRMPFKEMIAVLDAINGASREMKVPNGGTAKVPAFMMTLAAK